MAEKTLKEYCKDAKKRLKSGFWQQCYKGIDQEINRAEQEGLSSSKVKEYYVGRVEESIKSVDNDDEFYETVKAILISEGEIPNAIGRLTDKEYFETLTYEEKQRYTLSLSERYIKAVERFNKEKSLGYKDGVK